jgi:hypothetical protein
VTTFQIQNLILCALAIPVGTYAWPAARTATDRVCLLVVLVALPLLSWPWLLWRGHTARTHRRAVDRALIGLRNTLSAERDRRWWTARKASRDPHERHLAAEYLATRTVLVYQFPCAWTADLSDWTARQRAEFLGWHAEWSALVGPDHPMTGTVGRLAAMAGRDAS